MSNKEKKNAAGKGLFATLWRWAKVGYLVPINVGGKRRYRMSDVKRILEGDKGCRT